MYIYIYICNPNAVALIRAHVSMYILLHFIHVGYIYICHYTFLRIPMPHTPTSFRPPSLWPQVPPLALQALCQLQDPNCFDSQKESPLWKACAAGHASCLFNGRDALRDSF